MKVGAFLWYSFLLGICLLSLGCDAQKAPQVVPEASELQSERRSAMKASSDPGDPEAQCLAGGAESCRTLCDAQAAVCNKDSSEYDKDDCKSESKEVPICPSDPADMTLGELCRLPPSALSPTQGAVGMLAVSCKASSLEEKEEDADWKLRRYLMARPVPVVLGPGNRLFLTDHHHLATGLLQADVEDKNLYLCPMANRLNEASAAFWPYMINNNFTWLHNRMGEPITPEQLPANLDTIGDDPFRTLSRWVRDSCGYIKCGKVCGGDGADTSKLAQCEACSVAPYFLEFRWADYMRSRMADCNIVEGIYDLTTTQQAEMLPPTLSCLMNLVSEDAALNLGLPGWNHGLISTKEVVLDANGCEP